MARGSALWLLLSAAAFLTGGVLASFHPLSPIASLVGFVLWAALTVWRPAIWLLVLPATLPLANFSPWSGWIGIEEFDLLVLGTLSGGYLRRARELRRPAQTGQGPSWRVLPHVVGVALALVGLVGLFRGLADSGFALGWFQSYADPLNSLRVFKPLAGSLLLWPLLRREMRDSAAHAAQQFGIGMLLGLAVVSLAVVWERAAFPGLWDFSATYRATALFWEMHVGGAAIDAYLALAMPFVAWGLWAAKSPWQWAAAAALALVACYACLTTFSRGVYLAVGLPMLLLGLWLLARRLGFRASSLLRRALVYVVLGAAAAALWALLLETLGAWVVLALLALALMACLRRRLAGWRSVAGLGLFLALMLEVVAVFGAGSFMASRLEASDRDFGSRMEHWSNGLGLLYSPSDWAWGIGLGRLPASYARFVLDREFSGAAQWIDEPQDHGALRLHGPKTQSGLAGLYALTQRVPLEAEATYWLEFDARVRTRVDLAASVCEMHLLYEARCQGKQLRLRPGTLAWQQHRVELRGPPLPAGTWPAARLRVFALTVTDAGMAVDLDNLRLTAGAGVNLLDNGDFSRQLARWLPAAQLYFLPWHIDNLYLEWLIERGLAGLATLLALVGLALYNLLVGPGRRDPMAPFFAASLCGLLTVGLVSSVMDVPRVAFLFLLLSMLSLSLGEDSASRRRAP